MPKPITLELTDEERRELELVRDRSPLPYLRERAGAILKLAEGQSARAIARHGLLKPRWPEAVYRWYRGYKRAKVDGLVIRKGRGRKPSFSP
jgi:hypothetical protein